MTVHSNKSNRLTLYIIIAMIAGIALGFVINFKYEGKPSENLLAPFSILADIFLRLIKMIVAPLVFTTLAVGVARQGSLQSVGRIGGKTLLWFVGGSLVSLVLGMVLVNFFQPGADIHFTDTGVAANVPAHTVLSLKDFIGHIFPTSIFDAMAKNEILQVVVFSIFFGVAMAALHEKAAILIKALDAAAHVILKMTGYIMNFAPVAVFGAMTALIARKGLGIIGSLSVFIGEFYLALLILFCILMFAAWLVIRRRVVGLLQHIKEPGLVAFSTASSEAAYPKLLLQLERFGCDEKVVSFVLPLGYSLNLDGSMMYMTFASLFIAQACGIHLDMASQMTMLLILMLTSKGIAGVPRASLVVVAATLATFNIPEAGLTLILGIDPLLDMGRAAMNVVGNSVATVVVSKWEGALKHS
jgi:Na+/H+-dicarboxylate symporter